MIMKLWEYLNGKKTIIGFSLLFIYGGLTAIGYKVDVIKQIAEFIIGVGIAHKIEKI